MRELVLVLLVVMGGCALANPSAEEARDTARWRLPGPMNADLAAKILRSWHKPSDEGVSKSEPERSWYRYRFGWTVIYAWTTTVVLRDHDGEVKRFRAWFLEGGGVLRLEPDDERRAWAVITQAPGA